MGKRFFCLICAAVLVIVSVFGVRIGASEWESFPVGGAADMNVLAKTRPPYRANALVSAMFLVLAGVGISMLFDKKR